MPLDSGRCSPAQTARHESDLASSHSCVPSNPVWTELQVRYLYIYTIYIYTIYYIHIYYILYILYTIYTTLILHLEDRQLLRMRGSKVVAECIFNQLHVFLCIIKTPEMWKHTYSVKWTE